MSLRIFLREGAVNLPFSNPGDYVKINMRSYT